MLVNVATPLLKISVTPNIAQTLPELAKDVYISSNL